MGDEGQRDFDLIVDGGTIVTPGETIPRGTLAIKDGRIVYVGPSEEAVMPARAAAGLQADGWWVVPGLIDLHIHGAGGHDAAEGEIAGLSRTLAEHGVTAFLPTLIPQDRLALREIVARVAGAMRGEMPGAKPLGMHLEGPYLSPKQPGCLDASHFRPPDLAELRSLDDEATGMIRRMTVAVELPGMDALLPRLRDSGIAASLGHTEASYEEVIRAILRGLSQATHTFNAMAGFHHRDPGAVGAVLLSEEITAEVIADGRHVHDAALALLYRLKGPGRMLVASDAAPPAGLPPGSYHWAGHNLVLEGDALRTPEGKLAGSAMLLDGALRHLALEMGMTVPNAVAMATLTPAQALGIDGSKGSLAPGMDADLAVFDRSWRCQATVIGGKVIWRADEGK